MGEVTKTSVTPAPTHQKDNVHRKWLIIPVVLVVLVFAGVAGLGIVSKSNSKQAQPKPKTQSEIESDYIDQLQALLKKAKTNREKADIYDKIANEEVVSKKNTDALTHAQQAYSLDPTASRAAVVGAIASSQKNWKLATEWYKKAAAATPKTEPGVRSAYNEYLSQQKEAESHL